MSIGQVVVWIIVGGFAGTLAGRLVTLKKEGSGRWVNRRGYGVGGGWINR